MLRRLGIRGKVLAALSVPVLVLFALAGTISMQSIEDVRVARTVTELLGALDKARDLTRALQAERSATLSFVTAEGAERLDLRSELSTVRASTDAAIGAANRAANGIDLDQLDPVVNRAVTGLQDQMSALDDLRRAVDADRLSMRNAYVGYVQVAERVTGFPAVVAESLDDRRLATIIAAQTDVMMLVEDYRQEQVLGREILEGERGVAELNLLGNLFPSTNVQQESATLGVAQLELGERVVVPQVPLGGGTYGDIRLMAQSGASNFATFTTPEKWVELANEHINTYDPVLNELRAAGVVRAKATADAALRTAALTITLTLLAVTVSVVVALAIARRIVEPVRRLTAAAASVRDQLPKLVEQVAVPGQGPDLTLARIPVDSQDEIGRLAETFNQVNETTIEVAQEQAALRASIAEMFVNVARRDQVLLNRQLSFIDALERSEEDPATLADLFRLDHLATRMRRNAESLLVLAGIDTGRRLREPIPLSDVIRTASSEIEHYERVQLDLPVDPLMLGHVALPTAHLLAELLENATVFSDPGTPVHVSTGLDDTHAIITVLDQGLGMTAAELAEANDKIRTTSASDVVGAQRLGLFVVGRIAGRLGARVELGLGPDGTGTLATIRIPVVLFVDTASLPQTAPLQAAVHQPESFALPEEAAAVVHDAAFAPLPDGVQDVAPGSLGSVENPAEEVDLAALTDGQTGLGLPRRRSRGADAEAPAPSASYREQDDAAAAPSIPLAPAPESLAGAAGVPVEETWAPPVVQNAAPLAVRRREEPQEETSASGLPTRTPAQPSTGLPTRTPAPAAGWQPSGQEPTTATGPLPTRSGSDLPVRGGAPGLPVRTSSAPQVPAAPAAPASGPVAAPESRSAMFSGFRSRRAELAAAAIHQVESDTPVRPSGDGADRLAAAAAGAAAFFGRSGRDEASAQEPTAPEAPAFVVPQLVEDEDAPAQHEVVTHSATQDAAQAAAETAAEWSAEQPETGAEQHALAAWSAQPVADEPVAESFAEPFADLVARPVVEPVAEPVVEQVADTPVPQRAPEEPARITGRHALRPATDSPVWPPAPVAQQADAWGELEPAGWGSDPATPQPWAPPAPADEVAAVEVPQLELEPEEPALAPEPVWPVEDAEPWAQPAAEVTPWSEPAGLPAGQPLVDAPQRAEPAAEAPLWAAPSELTSEPAPAPLPEPSVVPDTEPTSAPALEQGLEPVPAAATPTWERTWDAPVPPAVEALAAATTGAAPAVAAAPAKRSWWPFGRKRPAQAVEPVATVAATPAALQAAPAPFPSAPAAFPPAPLDAPAPVAADAASFAPPVFEPPAAHAAPPAPPAAPVRESAWGSDPGAHAVPPVPVAEPSADVPRAAAFFPSSRPQATPSWEVPAPRPAPPQPAPPAGQAPAPAPAAPGAWTPEGGWDVPSEPWQPTPAPSTPESSAPLTSRPAPTGTFMPQTFTPEPANGPFDDEVTNMLAQRADIAQQALAELSQLSSYRPQQVSGAASSLVRRTPAAVPAAPEIETRPAGQRPERDANQVRSLLSSFQSGTTRGRQAGAPDGPQTTGVGASHTGTEDGLTGGHDV